MIGLACVLNLTDFAPAGNWEIQEIAADANGRQREAVAECERQASGLTFYHA
jgi:hypothetical protein